MTRPSFRNLNLDLKNSASDYFKSFFSLRCLIENIEIEIDLYFCFIFFIFLAYIILCCFLMFEITWFKLTELDWNHQLQTLVFHQLFIARHFQICFGFFTCKILRYITPQYFMDLQFP